MPEFGRSQTSIEFTARFFGLAKTDKHEFGRSQTSIEFTARFFCLAKTDKHDFGQSKRSISVTKELTTTNLHEFGRDDACQD